MQISSIRSTRHLLHLSTLVRHGMHPELPAPVGCHYAVQRRKRTSPARLPGLSHQDSPQLVSCRIPFWSKTG
jgi:hypothetical protein